MRILFLNTWYGGTGEILTQFIREHAESTDIFCFEEATDNVEAMAKGVLPEHIMVTAQKAYAPGALRQATFFRKEMTLRSSSPVLPVEENMGLGLYTEFIIGDQTLHVINYHGASMPGTKLDDTLRLAASRGIIEFLSGKVGARIVGGDFNLSPETKSVQMFEEGGYMNQIKKNSIVTTRNRLAWDIHSGEKQYYADYVFTSPEVKVTHFEVIVNEVSDHLPMIIDITL